MNQLNGLLSAHGLTVSRELSPGSHGLSSRARLHPCPVSDTLSKLAFPLKKIKIKSTLSLHNFALSAMLSLWQSTGKPLSSNSPCLLSGDDRWRKKTLGLTCCITGGLREGPGMTGSVGVRTMVLTRAKLAVIGACLIGATFTPGSRSHRFLKGLADTGTCSVYPPARLFTFLNLLPLVW